MLSKLDSLELLKMISWGDDFFKDTWTSEGGEGVDGSMTKD